MQTDNLIKTSVGVALGVVLLVTLALPLISSATETETTFSNEGYFYMDKITSSDTDTHTLSWDSTDGTILTVDGVDMDITTFGLSNYQQITVFATETDLLRLGVGNATQALSWVQIRGGTISYAIATSSAVATIGGGTAEITLDESDTPYTLTYSDAYCIAPDAGEYVMKKSNETAYMLEDSEIYALGYTGVTYGETNIGTVFKIEGTLSGVTVTSVMETDPTITTSNIVIVNEAVNGYVGLYSFDKITFDAIVDTDTTGCTYSYVIVPAEVTAENAVHFDSSEIAMLELIPLLLAVALVLGVVAYAVRARLS